MCCPTVPVAAFDSHGALQQFIARHESGLPVLVEEAFIGCLTPAVLGVEPWFPGFAGSSSDRFIHVIDHSDDIFGNRADAALARGNVAMEADDVGELATGISVHLSAKVATEAGLDGVQVGGRADGRRRDDLSAGSIAVPPLKLLLGLQTRPGGGPSTTQRASCSMRTS